VQQYKVYKKAANIENITIAISMHFTRKYWNGAYTYKIPMLVGLYSQPGSIVKLKGFNFFHDYVSGGDKKCQLLKLRYVYIVGNAEQYETDSGVTIL
jgi:hypothetical protein